MKPKYKVGQKLICAYKINSNTDKPEFIYTISEISNIVIENDIIKYSLILPTKVDPETACNHKYTILKLKEDSIFDKGAEDYKDRLKEFMNSGNPEDGFAIIIDNKSEDK